MKKLHGLIAMQLGFSISITFMGIAWLYPVNAGAAAVIFIGSNCLVGVCITIAEKLMHVVDDPEPKGEKNEIKIEVDIK